MPVSLQLEDLQSITESEEQSARQMEPDIRLLDKYKAELKEMDRNISLLQSKLHGVGKSGFSQRITLPATAVYFFLMKKPSLQSIFSNNAALCAHRSIFTSLPNGQVTKI